MALPLRLAREQSREQNRQYSSLQYQLTPLFEAGRAFKGHLNFEVQFGQVLLPYDVTGTFTPQVWKDRFEPKDPERRVPTSFTKVMTTNGVDIERMLHLKNGSNRSSKTLWDFSQTASTSAVYEFQCKDSNGQNFWVMVGHDGSYEVRKSSAIVGMVNIHVPERIWDACAVLEGYAQWTDIPDDVEEAVTQLVDSLYVPPYQSKVSMTFRLPDANSIAIGGLLVRRTSCFNLSSDESPEMILKVQEVKNLHTQCHMKDKKLHHGYERDYAEMEAEHRIHYEVSLVISSINNAFEANKSLELGELTDEATTGKSLLKRETLTNTLDLVIRMLENMDFIGAGNVGTLRKFDVRDALEHERVRNYAPPPSRPNVAPTTIRQASRMPPAYSIVGGSECLYTASAKIPWPHYRLTRTATLTTWA